MERQIKLNELSAALDEAINKMLEHGRKMAEAEHDYRVRVQQETLTERDNGTPATLIEKIVNGACADDRRVRDIESVYYRVALEKVQGIKKQMDIINDEINREWNK